MYHVTVPSGIGDVSWIYSKLCHADKLIQFDVADGWPYRTVPFLKLLPNVGAAGYSDLPYSTLCAMQSQVHQGMRTWDKVRHCPHIFLEANQHLERGKRLEDWLPDLPTDFHYPIAETSNIDHIKVNRLLDWEHLPRPLIAISAASYRGRDAWNTWGYDEWSPFLKALHLKVGGTIILVGGFWDDLTTELAFDEWPCLVGKTDVPKMVEVLRRVDYYLGFSSGLGILSTVLGKPTFMLFPEHLELLMYSWVEKKMLEDGTYQARLWDTWIDVLPQVVEQVKSFHFSENEKSCQPTAILI